MSRLFTSGGQSIGASASGSVLTMSIQDWFPLGLTGFISLQSKELSRVFSSHSSKASLLQLSDFYMVQLSHLCLTTERDIALTICKNSMNSIKGLLSLDHKSHHSTALFSWGKPAIISWGCLRSFVGRPWEEEPVRQPSEWATLKVVPPTSVKPADDCSPSQYLTVFSETP